MSEKEDKIEILNWNYDDKINMIELLIDIDGVQKTVPFNVEFLKEMLKVIPVVGEEKLIQDMLKKIYKIRDKRTLNVEKIDELVEGLRKQHDDARKKLIGIENPSAKGKKNEILIQATIIKSLAAEKVLLDEKRYLTKLLSIEEGDLRARLARMKTKRAKS